MLEYSDVKNMIDSEEDRTKQFIKYYKKMSLEELRKEVLDSVKYAQKMEDKLDQEINNPTESGEYASFAYAQLCYKYVLLLDQYKKLMTYTSKLRSDYDKKTKKRKTRQKKRK